MENARELAMGRFSHHLEVLTEDLEQQGYDVNCQVHSLSDFGLPQARERALIVATEKGLTPRTLVDLWDGWSTRPGVTTVRHAIAHLPPIGAGERHPEDGMHVSPAFGSPRTLQRLSQIPHDGGSWMDLVRSNRTDLMTPSMHRSVQRGTLGSHPDVYGRLWWDRPSVTIKRECAHVGNGRYSHPEQDRMLSLREVALLNGFPTDYLFSGAGLANQYRHVGDAVPPLISYQMAWATSWTFTGQRPEPASFVLPGTSLTARDIVSSHELVA
jgi:DNA (cytosine-5)-methyltransferase 1